MVIENQELAKSRVISRSPWGFLITIDCKNGLPGRSLFFAPLLSEPLHRPCRRQPLGLPAGFTIGFSTPPHLSQAFQPGLRPGRPLHPDRDGLSHYGSRPEARSARLGACGPWPRPSPARSAARHPSPRCRAEEGLLVSLDHRGTIDLPYIATLYGRSEERIIEELSDLIYHNPNRKRGGPPC